jgi:DNA-binding HxlR family transcriptional regulator
MIKHRPNKAGPVPNGCPLEFGLKFLAGAWTHQILWYLRTEPRRFGDLKRDLNGVSAKVLTTRLRELEEQDVITRTVMPTSPPTVEYALTPLGLKLMPVLNAILEVSLELQRKEKKQLSKDVAHLNKSKISSLVSVSEAAES